MYGTTSRVAAGLKGKDGHLSPTGFIYDDIFLRHVTPAGHPESPERLRHLLSHLERSDVWGQVRRRAPVDAPIDAIAAVHTPHYIDAVSAMCDAGGGMLDGGDTFASRDSFRVALAAAGAVLTAVDAVLGGELASAFCAVRPPGHHAERTEAMGFCLFNNAAIGARHAQHQHGIRRVAIIDWDVHHGNGTQHIFEDDPTVLYVSTHQYPFYPGTGAREERGSGRGEGYTLNIPLVAGSGEAEYLAAFREQVVPALERFQPGLLIISAGFDAHEDDPLADMKLTAASYARLTALIKPVAPLVSVLEGGYSYTALAQSVEHHLRALIG